MPLNQSVAAISVGMVDGRALCDLDYGEDSTAEVDANVVMTGDGGLVEVQATAERTPLSRASLDELLALAEGGIARLRSRPRRPASCPPEPGPGDGAADPGHPQRAQAAELREALPGVEIEPLPEGVVLPPETGETFAENALGKARAAHEATGRPAIADDSGIEAAALGGRPGCGRPASRGGSERRGEPEEADLGAQGGGRPRARLRLRDRAGRRDGSESLFEGRCTGTLAPEPRGTGGFGYDPAFVPDDTGPGDARTMAELGPPRSMRSATAGGQPGSWRGRSGRRKGRERRVATERAGITKPVAAGVSIASNAILIALKLAAAAITGSIAILSEALHSMIDLIASVIAFVAVRRADEPADPSTPTGTRRSSRSRPRSRAC